MATITSTQTGDWHATGTWVGGAVPANNDLVVIAHGHKVTLSTDIQAAITDNVTIDGNLHFADGGKMHLNGRMTVKNTSNSNNTAGEFVTDSTSSGSLLSMVSGTEIKISGNNSAQHGIQVDARKWCGVDIAGSEPTLKTELNGNHVQRSMYLTVDDSANFAAGDLISIYKREEDFRLKNDECFWVHDVDTTNHRIYFRQFVHPMVKNKPPIITSVSGATITVDDANVFRVNYQLLFGTGDNRNALVITGINKNTNVITFGSTVDGDPSLVGEYVYQTGNEKYHLNDSHVRRTSSCMTNTFSGATSLRTISVNNAADFSTGDRIYIEACGDASYHYASGSETNHWRHNLMYTISGVSGLTLTVDRDILYDGEAGGLITRMTRDVVIKACATNGDDVADGDQDTARVFFNVKYWTNNSWYSAPTRRVKIKYIQFLGLGYQTSDSTNLRQGVNIAGYNGYYDTKITGSAEDNTTIHNTSGVSQTGENYFDGCSYSAYNLCSNSTRDGDSYPGICSRHPYGMLFRNCVIIGAGRGMWHWSTQHYIKSHGHIIAACNYVNMAMESAYSSSNEYSYMYLRMSEDYSFLMYHLRQGTSTIVQHFNIQYQAYGLRFEYNNSATVIRRFYVNKYKYLYTPSGTDASTVVLDSQVMPNYWDASSYIYGDNHTPLYNQNAVAHYTDNYNAPYRGSSARGRWSILEHGFREDESVEFHANLTKLNRGDSQVSEWLSTSQYTPSAETRIFVPANCAVKLRSSVKVNATQYDGDSDTVDDNSLPVLIARSIHNAGLMGRHNAGVVTDTGSVRTFEVGFDLVADSNDRVGLVNSTDGRGKLHGGWIEYVKHTSSAQSDWETKELTIAAQYEGYELIYGYYIDNNDMYDVGFKSLPIDIILSKPSSLNADKFQGISSIGRKSIRTSFTANKKRISGRI